MVKQTILITGWSGFVGQHLVQRLKPHHNLLFLKSDLRDHQAVRQEVQAADADLVLHLAARTEVEQSFYEQVTFSEINYVGTVNLLESMASCTKIPRLIFASTMEVFGWQPISDDIQRGQIPLILPVFDPDTTTANPNAPYAVAKLACENYIHYLHRTSGLEYVIIRQTNSYGRKDNSFFVTEQIITQMLTNPAQCNLGYREPFRNFLYVDDLIDAWQVIIEQFDAVKNQCYTLGPNNAIRIKDYADMIADLIGWQGDIIWDTRPARPGEIWVLNSSEDKLYNRTGWRPRIDLAQGLQLTIDAWKNEMHL